MVAHEYGAGWGEVAAQHSEVFQQTKQLIAGGIAGCAGKTAGAPLSRVTVLMQVQSMRPHKYTDGARPNNRSMARSIVKIYREEGVLAFWRGNGAMLLHRFPYTALTFWGRSILEGWLCENPGYVPQWLHVFTAAGLGATVACTCCYPLDIVKTRIMAQTGRKYYRGVGDAFVKIWLDEGVQGLFRGLPITMMSVVPMIALNFAFYDQFMLVFQDVGSPRLHSLLAGGSAGALVSTLLFPIDLIRRQMQMVGVGGRPLVYAGTADAVRQVFNMGFSSKTARPLPRWWRAGLGCREFFRGLLPELVKVTPQNAVMFFVHRELLSVQWPCEV